MYGWRELRLSIFDSGATRQFFALRNAVPNNLVVGGQHNRRPHHVLSSSNATACEYALFCLYSLQCRDLEGYSFGRPPRELIERRQIIGEPNVRAEAEKK